MKSVMTQTLWKSQIMMAQDEIKLGSLHADMHLNAYSMGDTLILEPNLAVWVEVTVRTSVRDGKFGLHVLSSVKDMLADQGQVTHDHKDLGFRMRLDLDPWSKHESIMGIMKESAQSLGFGVAYQTAGLGLITRSEIMEGLRRAPHLIMLSKSLGHTPLAPIEHGAPSIARFLEAVSVGALRMGRYWHQSYSQEYDDLLSALSQSTVVMGSWEKEPPCP